MGRREKLRPRLDRDAVVEHERLGLEASAAKASNSRDSSDDEANKDLSLEIVEKALLLRAARLVPENDNYDKGCVVSAESNGIEEKAAGLPSKKVVKKVIKKVIKKTKVVKKKETTEQNVFVMKEEDKDKPETNEVVADAVAQNTVEELDNIVFRKLLRGPRYFDSLDSSWGMCYNCGEEGHMAVNCTSAKRRKPCFVCGSLDHNVKQCTKGQDCFVCKKTGHRAKDCPDKYKSSSIESQICLKCGDSGHDMFSCRNDYYLDDLKEISCYVCNKLGHICCAKYVDSHPKEVSCYRCGQLGHIGLTCTRPNGETTGGESASSCYNCGKVGHFARECTNSSKNGKRFREPSTPKLRPHKEPKQDKGHKSAPQDLGKAHKKNKTQHGGNSVTTPRKPKHRGGWITEDPRDYSFERSRNSDWRSPATPRDHRIQYFTPGGHVPTPQSSKHSHYAYGTPNFQGHPNDFYRFQNGHSGSRYGYHGSGGSDGAGWNARNYGW